ncbi:hypothetical protein JCM10212_006913 [Sporobolomyces blumeae]
MPTSLVDLPIELLPNILAPLVRRRDLYHACLVSREFYRVARVLLYRSIRLFGRDLSIVTRLFEVLASAPPIAHLVRRLEVRVYPLSLILKERRAMEDLAIRALKNCTNVEELVWTRKGSLTDSALETIVKLPRLHTFEFNAHTNLSPGSWSASLLVDLPVLRSLSLILPDRNVAVTLPALLSRQRDLVRSREGDPSAGLALEELSMLCRESTVINDRVVSDLAPYLANSRLRSLGLAGCSRLTAAPLLQLLPTLPHLRNLALEACQLDPTFYSLVAPALSNLCSLKLTHPGPRHPSLSTFFPALESLLEHTTHLTAFTLYHSGASASDSREWPTVPQGFIENLTNSVGRNLRKFEVSGVLISVDAVESLARGSNGIRDLVLHLGTEYDLGHLASCFAHLSSLRTLHLLSQRPDVYPNDVLGLAEQCSPTLRQIGFRNRVWLIRRTFESPSSDDAGGRARDGERIKIRFIETAAAFGAFRRNRYGAEEDVEIEPDSDEEREAGSDGGSSDDEAV